MSEFNDMIKEWGPTCRCWESHKLLWRSHP